MFLDDLRQRACARNHGHPRAQDFMAPDDAPHRSFEGGGVEISFDPSDGLGEGEWTSRPGPARPKALLQGRGLKTVDRFVVHDLIMTIVADEFCYVSEAPATSDIATSTRREPE